MRYKPYSNRWQNWDYSNSAHYFVTICTENRECFLGEIHNKEMILSESGEIVTNVFLEIPNKFNFVQISTFIVMPNHFHTILTITQSTETTTKDLSDNDNTYYIGGFAGDKNPLLNKNLGHIIHWFKERCTYEIRKRGFPFQWQANYHDHIIRNSDEYLSIYQYIQNNPQHWEEDSLNI